MKSKAGIITQVRMTSTRLPGKVLKPAGGISLLEHHYNRLKWAEIPLIIATTTNKEDDPV
jgi:spore coat polysaccharide biosynthesis protein SpsF